MLHFVLELRPRQRPRSACCPRREESPVASRRGDAPCCGPATSCTRRGVAVADAGVGELIPARLQGCGGEVLERRPVRVLPRLADELEGEGLPDGSPAEVDTCRVHCISGNEGLEWVDLSGVELGRHAQPSPDHVDRRHTGLLLGPKPPDMATCPARLHDAIARTGREAPQRLGTATPQEAKRRRGERQKCREHPDLTAIGAP